MDFSVIRERINELVRRFAAERPHRQRRTALDPMDFEALRRAGYPLVAVPAEMGGAFGSLSSSVRPLCSILRALGSGDPSVALVCAMHPAVLVYWLAFPTVPDPFEAEWQAQRRELLGHAAAGSFFGTITSESGSGGDIALTRAVARRSGSGYLLDGQKHFGSGSGITSFWITSAIPEGEQEPDWFMLDVRGVEWDGSRGVKLVGCWEGHGMPATQSHAMSFSGYPATRHAWPGHRKLLSSTVSPFVGCLFAAVVTGIIDSAMGLAQAQLAPRRRSLRAFEQMELARAEIDAWLIAQAFEGMLRAAEADPVREREVTQGKLAISELAESCTQRLCRVLGGGSYSRSSPLGYLFEDVRALGFLRPPWGLSFQSLIGDDA